MTRDEFHAYLDSFEDWTQAAAIIRPAVEYAPENARIGPYTKNGRTLGWTFPIGDHRRSGLSETGGWTICLDATFPPDVRRSPNTAKQIRDDAYDLLVRFNALPDDTS